MADRRDDPASGLRPVRARVRAGFDRVAAQFDEHAFIEPRIRERLLERLDLVRLAPSLVVDAGCGTGAASASLAARYRGANVLAVDLAPRMAARAALRNPRWRRHRIRAVCADAAALPLPAQSVDLVVSNLMLPWHPDPDAVFAECRRVLRPGGLLTFSSLGPDTLRELRAAWTAVDGAAHVNLFTDMHDVGDALLRAGLAEPVMDVETLHVDYGALERLVADLRLTTAGNVLAGGPRGLGSRTRRTRLEAAYPRTADGRFGATVEVVYGHAWGTGTPPQRRQRAGEVRIPVSGLARRPRPGGT